jgi:hypothetical protein
LLMVISIVEVPIAEDAIASTGIDQRPLLV